MLPIHLGQCPVGLAASWGSDCRMQLDGQRTSVCNASRQMMYFTIQRYQVGKMLWTSFRKREMMKWKTDSCWSPANSAVCSTLSLSEAAVEEVMHKMYHVRLQAEFILLYLKPVTKWLRSCSAINRQQSQMSEKLLKWIFDHNWQQKEPMLQRRLLTGVCFVAWHRPQGAGWPVISCFAQWRLCARSARLARSQLVVVHKPRATTTSNATATLHKSCLLSPVVAVPSVCRLVCCRFKVWGQRNVSDFDLDHFQFYKIMVLKFLSSLWRYKNQCMGTF